MNSLLAGTQSHNHEKCYFSILNSQIYSIPSQLESYLELCHPGVVDRPGLRMCVDVL